MSDFLHETVPPMPPLSLSAIETLGEELLAELDPTALIQPAAIDFAEWAECRLQKYRICVTPASAEELQDRLGATDPQDRGGGFVDILMESSHYDALLQGGRSANQARATLAHEFGHSVLHVPVMRRRSGQVGQILFGRMMPRRFIPAFRDPEWQAWALAGCIAAPRRTILMAETTNPRQLAGIFRMSEAFMASHLKRLRLLAPGDYQSGGGIGTN